MSTFRSPSILVTVVRTWAEVLAGSGLVVLGTAVLVWSADASSSIIALPVGATAGLALVIGFDRASKDRSWFPRWPVPATRLDAAVAVIGYVGVTALSTLVGVVVLDLSGRIGPSLLVAAIASVWFFKHLHFFLTFDEDPV